MHRSIFESWEVFMVAFCASGLFPVIRMVWRKPMTRMESRSFFAICLTNYFSLHKFGAIEYASLHI